jgi:regulator of replication initiation timing
MSEEKYIKIQEDLSDLKANYEELDEQNTKLQAALDVAKSSLDNAEKYLTDCGFGKDAKTMDEYYPEDEMVKDFRKTLAKIEELLK